jgi:hypothetical protein
VARVVARAPVGDHPGHKSAPKESIDVSDR